MDRWKNYYSMRNELRAFGNTSAGTSATFETITSENEKQFGRNSEPTPSSVVNTIVG